MSDDHLAKSPKKYGTVVAILVALVLVVVLYYAFRSEKMMTMTINAENMRDKSYSLSNVMYGNSPDPRFNLMTAKKPEHLTSNIYALGQHDAPWRVWRPDGKTENLTANIYALGQHDAQWRVWRPDTVRGIEIAEAEEGAPREAFSFMKMLKGATEKYMPQNQYGALGKGSDRASTVTLSNRAGTETDVRGRIRDMRTAARMREKLDNNDVFRGPPGYDITIVRDKSEENLSNSITWQSLGSQEKMGTSRDAVLMSSLYSL